MNHAFEVWPSLCDSLRKYKRILLCLDFDGTLIPIAQRPELAVLSQKARSLLEFLRLNERFRLCIVSGRALADLKARVGVEGIIYAGNHGLELEGQGVRFINTKAKKSRTLIRGICKKLDTSLEPVAGIVVEDKGLSLSLHYRLVKKKDIPTVKALFDKVVQPYYLRREVKVSSGKKVLEVRPFTRWDKGKAVLWVLRRFKVRLKTDNIIPIYIGDDWTDESAFIALRRKGLSIFVGHPNSITHAHFFLRSPKEVEKFLERLRKIPF